MKHRVGVLAALLIGLAGCSHAQTRGQAADETDQDDRDIKAVKTIGDVTEVGPITPTQVSGVGLVTGLQGTGGPAPASDYRKMLEDQLHKQGVQNVKELLVSPNHTLVLVSARIPVGIRKGEPIDVEVTLPPQSKATSLRGGYLLDCPLRNYESTHNLSKDNKDPGRLLPGHILANAHGPLLVGLGEGNEEVRLRRGRIWEGGVSHLDVPFFLYLKSDQRFASVANTVATRINSAFPDDTQRQYQVRQAKRLLVLDEVTSQINDKFHGTNGAGCGETAHALTKDVVHVKVPYEYRLTPERYLLVIRLIPLRESAQTAGKYRQRLQEMLLDPRETIRAALRLEALGKESIPALKKGLASNQALVRFAAAEALTYLGNTAGIDELSRLAEKHETLRGHCLAAMASMDEAISQTKLADLMASTRPQVRIGAFRALLAANELSAEIQGELLNDAFWLHQVAPRAQPMVHLSTNRRAEIVIFGEVPKVLPPLRLPAGSEFTVTAEAGDTRCTVSRFVVNAGQVARKQCSFQLDDILHTMAAMGAQYPDAVEFLHQADRHKCLAASVMVDALPEATPLELLAACGNDPNRFKDKPAFQQEVLAAQQDLGMTR
jgi:hypothetical protein